MKRMRLQDGTKVLFNNTSLLAYFLEGPVVRQRVKEADLVEGWGDIMPEFKWEGAITWGTGAQWCKCIYLEDRAFAVRLYNEWQVIKFAENRIFKLRDW